MANKLPNEKELFEQLSRERIIISGNVWSIIYSSVEDSILIIKLIVTLYRDQNKNIPIDQAKKILANIQEVSSVFRKLIKPQIIKTEEKGLLKISSESKNLHPIIREMFAHYIGNDIQSLNFIIGDYIDDKKNLDKPVSDKIMRHIADMEEFLLKLKANTESLEERLKNQLTLPLVYLNNLKNTANEADKSKIEKCITSLEEINKFLEGQK